jgi:flagellar hook assembly protein FlgD
LTPKPPNPSPAKDAVWLPYIISADADVDIRIFNVSGELVLALGPVFQTAGAHERKWDLHNQAGTRVASGVYLCRIIAKSRRNEEADVWVKVAVSR